MAHHRGAAHRQGPSENASLAVRAVARRNCPARKRLVPKATSQPLIRRSCQSLAVKSTHHAIRRCCEWIQFSALAKSGARLTFAAHRRSVSQWVASSREEVLSGPRVVHGSRLRGPCSVPRHLRDHRLSQAQQSAPTMSKRLCAGCGNAYADAWPMIRTCRSCHRTAQAARMDGRVDRQGPGHLRRHS